MAAAKKEGMIFKATYSGVPVYECIIKGVAVMRRRADGWINATHILKVVGLDKPQRTRVLERDVQKGDHEKVQGGYGKYQGTWIPLPAAIELARNYNMSNLFDPLTSYVPSAESPPPAPKHIVAASSRSKKPNPVLERARRGTSIDSGSLGSGMGDGTERSISPALSDVSSSSRTPSPIITRERGQVPDVFDDRGLNGYTDAYGVEIYDQNGQDSAARYSELILDYFISESTTVPSLLINPPADFDANMSIDDDEHTALHWACAMGRVRVVKLLLSAGADVFRVNANGQTALMRAAMFSNNYDLRKFPELFELLHRSILNIDRNDRTVFHHVVDLALSRNKANAARYYMETMINRLAEYGSQLADILNFRDDEGETPLTMAARARSKRLTRLLLEHGADPKIRNKENKNAEDYIVEDERFRASPTRGADGTPALASSSTLHTSEAGQRAGGRAVALMTNLLHSLADSYDSEVSTVEKRLSQAQGLLLQIQGEIAEGTKTYDGLIAQAAASEAEQRAQDDVERALRVGLQKRSREEMEADWKIVQDGVKRARRDAGLSEGELLETSDANDSSTSLSKTLLAPTSSSDVDADLEKLREEVAKLKQERGELLEKFISTAREQGTGKTMAAYRRLIAGGVGGINQDQVDAVVSALCDLLEEEAKAGGPTGGGGAGVGNGAGGLAAGQRLMAGAPSAVPNGAGGPPGAAVAH
ncbi:apses-domain-containing protein [Microstroma glucosiphilum]|uniref:Apses-domain-containing protein n=1 Tax=Pseudomicrostroma glucosiphilum TaxID=1684307 RepID=A0A316UHP4_9BASI|nr:apses-domain-containing protein [Pseudomicrostroma glucosiphilum]PWN23851.1 apses-domain-containing protein [Pseudomicrostroma glucosiphilum]